MYVAADRRHGSSSFGGAYIRQRGLKVSASQLESDRATGSHDVAKVVDWELRQALMAGAAKNAQHLARSNQALQQLVHELPTEPAQLYQIISTLAGRLPHLTTKSQE